MGVVREGVLASVTIMEQPKDEDLKAAYRPVIIKVSSDRQESARPFTITVLDTYIFNISPKPAAGFSAGDNITISIEGSVVTATVTGVTEDSTSFTVVIDTVIPATGVNTGYLTINTVQEVGNFGAVPPVVYCDIYFHGIYYKSLSRTQPDILNSTSAEYIFDIADAAQEYLKFKVPVNGGTEIIAASEIFSECFCRFRNSAYDENGFIKVQSGVPRQGTGMYEPAPGGGVESTHFYVVNSSLQHEDNQDLATHLQSFKTGTWQDEAYPLSHRPAVYKICPGDSDYFPIIYLGDKDLTCLRLNYKSKGETDFIVEDYCYPVAPPPCVAPALPPLVFSAATEDTAIPVYTIVVFQTLPITLSGIVKPDWMTIEILNGNQITITGTPPEGSAGNDIPVQFTVTNDCGTDTVNTTIDVLDDDCITVEFESEPLIAAIKDEPYTIALPITGTPIFTLTNLAKPSWMTIAIDGSEVHISGTPTVLATSQGVSFDITNCGGIVHYESSINVEASTGTTTPPPCKSYRLHGGSTGTMFEYVLCNAGTTATITVGAGITKTKCAQTGSVDVVSGEGSYEDSGFACSYDG